MNYFILNGILYNSFKVFFWVGSRSSDYEKNFEDATAIIKDFEQGLPNVKVRFYIEYQHSESLQFFTLFRRYDMAIERTIEISAVAYQEFYKSG